MWIFFNDFDKLSLQMFKSSKSRIVVAVTTYKRISKHIVHMMLRIVSASSVFQFEF